ncbi:MAG: bifunctional phosphoribosyl-AMP cyclohydrolase/phosphoribosyl-ATP pyrophosphatase [Gracilibacter sp. BRH_c7a]|nr:MAG: bifunctional phosphoribosyl-AMP cyclohydrolase/phosphoribosyl-ATP pyrophosphatase [Gracilibacter sp. BRH_c7a]
MNDKISDGGNYAKREKALEDIRWNTEGLIPVVVQDEVSSEVLMLAYMNKEALLTTLEQGRACYYSRSRQKLWIKGETSGNYQEVIDIRFDCDKDTILLKVKQTGMACHEDFYSCFHYKLKENSTTERKDTAVNWLQIGEPNRKPELSLGRTIELLAEVINKRNEERPEGAYTTYLFDKGIDKILKKVGEESAEVIIAAKNNSADEIRYESADLIYHLLVLLEDRGVSINDIARELNSRRK